MSGFSGKRRRRQQSPSPSPDADAQTPALVGCEAVAQTPALVGYELGAPTPALVGCDASAHAPDQVGREPGAAVPRPSQASPPAPSSENDTRYRLRVLGLTMRSASDEFLFAAEAMDEEMNRFEAMARDERIAAERYKARMHREHDELTHYEGIESAALVAELCAKAHACEKDLELETAQRQLSHQSDARVVPKLVEEKCRLEDVASGLEEQRDEAIAKVESLKIRLAANEECSFSISEKLKVRQTEEAKRFEAERPATLELEARLKTLTEEETRANRAHNCMRDELEASRREKHDMRERSRESDARFKVVLEKEEARTNDAETRLRGELEADMRKTLEVREKEEAKRIEADRRSKRELEARLKTLEGRENDEAKRFEAERRSKRELEVRLKTLEGRENDEAKRFEAERRSKRELEARLKASLEKEEARASSAQSFLRRELEANNRKNIEVHENDAARRIAVERRATLELEARLKTSLENAEARASNAETRLRGEAEASRREKSEVREIDERRHLEKYTSLQAHVQVLEGREEHYQRIARDSEALASSLNEKQAFANSAQTRLRGELEASIHEKVPLEEARVAALKESASRTSAFLDEVRYARTHYTRLEESNDEVKHLEEQLHNARAVLRFEGDEVGIMQGRLESCEGRLLEARRAEMNPSPSSKSAQLQTPPRPQVQTPPRQTPALWPKPKSAPAELPLPLGTKAPPPRQPSKIPTMKGTAAKATAAKMAPPPKRRGQ